METLPEELIGLIISFIKYPGDQKNIRQVNKLFNSFIKLFTIKVSSLNENLQRLEFEQSIRFNSKRNKCININCKNENNLIHKKPSKCTGNLYLFQYNMNAHIALQSELEFPETNYLWLHHDSNNPDRYIKKQVNLLKILELKKINKNGDFSKIYIPYCPICSAKFIVEKLPPYINA